jgi:hypothetical protein
MHFRLDAGGRVLAKGLKGEDVTRAVCSSDNARQDTFAYPREQLASAALGRYRYLDLPR